MAILWKDPMLIQEVCGEPQMSHDEYRGLLLWLFLEPTMNNESLGNKNRPDFFS